LDPSIYSDALDLDVWYPLGEIVQGIEYDQTTVARMASLSWQGWPALAAPFRVPGYYFRTFHKICRKIPSQTSVSPAGTLRRRISRRTFSWVGTVVPGLM
jgi:hypothetical protein